MKDSTYVCLWRFDGPAAGPLAPLDDEVDIDLGDFTAVDAVPAIMVEEPVSSRTITTPIPQGALSLLLGRPTRPLTDAALAALIKVAKQS
jgi:hypothetical protein